MYIIVLLRLSWSCKTLKYESISIQCISDFHVERKAAVKHELWIDLSFASESKMIIFFGGMDRMDRQ
jgi:hypothetical protein